MKTMMTPVCKNCRKRFVIAGFRSNPVMLGFRSNPVMLGFKLANGKTINLCYDCLCKLGQLPEDEKEYFIRRLEE